MNENIIDVRNLTKIYDDGNVLAVDDISFSIEKGEIFALLGPNGAGKTTTISMLATLLNPTKGDAFVNSYDVSKDSSYVRKSIGIVFQEPSVDGDMKARENLELHAILYGMSKKQRREKIVEVLKLVDLHEQADMFVKNFSGGMKRRLEIARGLMHAPRVLFLDEPTLGLDPQTRRKIWDKIKELNEGDLKMTILITTHYMEEADFLADRICIMDHGKIIAMDTSENLKKQLSGDVIDLELEEVKEPLSFREFVESLRSIPEVKNVSLGNPQNYQEFPDISMNLPKNMPKIDPEMIKARIRETMSDPKKLVTAWKRFPMAAQMFINAPFAMKKKVADMIPDEMMNQVPEFIREELVKIKSGEIQPEEGDKIPKLSISCVNGSKQISEIIQKVNDFNLSIKTVNMHQPTLEDVFLHFTGKAIRKESANYIKGVKKMIQMRQLRGEQVRGR